jgi:hypothetical protein
MSPFYMERDKRQGCGSGSVDVAFADSSRKSGRFSQRCGEVNAQQRVGAISHGGHTANDGARVRPTFMIDTHTTIGYH